MYFLLEWDRKTLYQRIDKRVDQMIAQDWKRKPGTVSAPRVQPLANRGIPGTIRLFRKERPRWKKISLIKHTRNYAKRQLTWVSQTRRMDSF
ncbi:MAG: hypothetical protein IPL49_11010 [Saprospirales bacterium]|nr:hypothetical protein [Saprospirales bacterium]